MAAYYNDNTIIYFNGEFVKASAYAKIVNSVTNLSALIVFVKNMKILGFGVMNLQISSKPIIQV